MGGFLGYFSPLEAPLTSAVVNHLEESLALLAHRGPDDSAISSGPGWWMGFRRLSILDLTECARQPMEFGEDRWLVFNGEIYNFRALRNQFAPSEFRSTGDTEVLGKLLARFGPDVTLRQIRGMFAFAFWDARRRELVFARDPFGIKPLYWVQTADGGIAIASEMASLQRLRVAGEVSREGVLSYFKWGGIEAPGTMFSQVNLLPPGSVAHWSGGEVKVERCFLPQWLGEKAWLYPKEPLFREVRERVIGSVKAHLESGVPVGVFLSGSLDSNILCAALRELGVNRMQTFSVGYDGPRGIEDESETARRSAEFFGAECVVERVSASSLSETFDHFISRLDSPSGDALNIYLVSRTASRYVKVALSGLGANEWFAGYNYFLLAKIARAFPFWRVTNAAGLKKLARRVFGCAPIHLREKSMAKLVALIAGAMGTTLPEWYRAFYTVLSNEEIDLLIAPELAAGREKEPANDSDWQRIEAELEQRAPDSWINVLNLLETEHHLPNVILRDCDAMSMAHSLELRVPLIDREIFHLAGQVPPKMKLRSGVNKRVLREAFRPLLPPWINEIRKMKASTLPLVVWLRDPAWRERVHDTLLSERCRDRGWLNPRQIRLHLDDFYGSRESDRRDFGLSWRIWLMLVLESWARSHLDGLAP